jgi:hypothetical protein
MGKIKFVKGGIYHNTYPAYGDIIPGNCPWFIGTNNDAFNEIGIVVIIQMIQTNYVNEPVNNISPRGWGSPPCR